MIAMWTIALAVLGAAQVLFVKRLGLVRPALGWMAATLFALVGTRNAAPGSPPIGCLLDYVAFFWAEIIVALGLSSTAAVGRLSEWRSRRHEQGPEQQPPQPQPHPEPQPQPPPTAP